MTPLLQVFDMARSLKFYCDVLGFEIVQTDTNTTAPNHNWVWLRLNNVDLMLNTAYEYDKRLSTPDPRSMAMHGDKGQPNRLSTSPGQCRRSNHVRYGCGVLAPLLSLPACLAEPFEHLGDPYDDAGSEPLNSAGRCSPIYETMKK
jgi:catechol 2,3-dioxygenase-like lactoylglutathione lyase family enzyme